MTRVDLPPPETPVTQVKSPSGIVAVTSLRLLPRRHRDRPLAGEIVAGQRIGIGGNFGRRSLGDDLAPVHAGARADINDVIGGPDRILVVLDDDHRIAQAPQTPERVEEPRVVALVEADRRFVEYIKHAGEARADLRSEPDALALAARQRAGR